MVLPVPPPLAVGFVALLAGTVLILIGVVRGWHAHGEELYWVKPPTRNWFLAGLLSMAIAAGAVARLLLVN